MPLPYKASLKTLARQLWKNATDSENILWSRVRHKQLLGVRFYRQKPIGEYIVDFYAPKAKLVVEVDGSQHLDPIEAEKDRRRDQFLGSLGLKVVRFSSREVLEEIEAVVEAIFGIMHDLVQEEIPLDPPFAKGEA